MLPSRRLFQRCHCLLLQDNPKTHWAHFALASQILLNWGCAQICCLHCATISQTAMINQSVKTLIRCFMRLGGGVTCSDYFSDGCSWSLHTLTLDMQTRERYRSSHLTLCKTQNEHFFSPKCQSIPSSGIEWEASQLIAHYMSAIRDVLEGLKLLNIICCWRRFSILQEGVLRNVVYGKTF